MEGPQGFRGKGEQLFNNTPFDLHNQGDRDSVVCDTIDAETRRYYDSPATEAPMYG